MVTKSTLAAMLAVAGGLLMVLSGLMFTLSGTIFMVLIFGSNFLYLAFLLIGSVVIIGSGMMVNRNPKNARFWGVVMVVFGVILELMLFRAFTLLFRSLPGIAAVLGGILTIIGGFFAVTSKPQPSSESPVEQAGNQG